MFSIRSYQFPVASVPKKEIIYLFRLCDSKFAKTECDYRTGLSTSNGVFDTCDRSGLSQPGDQYPDNIFMCFLHSFQINDVIVFFHGATATSELGPPFYRGFTITLSRHTTLGRTPLVK